MDKSYKKIIEKMEAMLSKADDEKRDLTADEENRYQEYEQLLDEIKDDNDIEAIRSEIENSKPKRTLDLKYNSNSAPYEYTERGVIGGLSDPVNFFQMQFRDKRTMYDYMEAVMTGRTMVPPESHAMTVGTGAEGGFAATDTYAKGFWSSVHNQSTFLKYCRMYNFEGHNSINIVAWDSEDQTAGPFGNVSADWKAESAQFTAKTPNVRNVNITPNKLGLFVNVSREASQDTDSLVAELGGL